MTRLLVVLMMVCVAAQAHGSDCSVTSIGIAPSSYVRSAAHQGAGVAAGSSIVPRAMNGAPSSAGTIGMLCLGMSIANQVCGETVKALAADPAKRPAFKFIKAAFSGHGADAWASPSSTSWTRTALKVDEAGLSSLQVQAAVIMMTQDHGVMTEGQLRAIVDNLHALYPLVTEAYLSPTNYMGYVDPQYWTKVHEPRNGINDALLMASLVEAGGWPIWVDFSDLWADGLTINPLNGLSYACADMAVDGHHPTKPAAKRMGQSWIARWKPDPVTTWMWQP